MKRTSGISNQNIRNQRLRNQYGMALWVKILLGLFGAGLLIAIVGSIVIFSFVKDMTDPKKTEEVANKIVTLVQPLPPPFEYGRMNVSMFGYSGALISNTENQALFLLVRVPKKDANTGAQKLIEQVANPDAASAAAPGGALPAKGSMKVEDKGELEVGGSKLYYVLGKASSAQGLRGASASTSEPAPTFHNGNSGATEAATVETFLGAADPKQANETTIIIVQQDNSAKHLTMDQVKAFTKCIKAF